MMLQELKNPTYDNVSSGLSPSTIHVLWIKCAIFFVKDLLDGKSWVQNTVMTNYCSQEMQTLSTYSNLFILFRWYSTLKIHSCA